MDGDTSHVWVSPSQAASVLSHIQRMQQPNLEAAQGQTDTSVVGYRPLTELLLKGPGPARAAVLHSLFDNIGKPVDSPDTRPLWLLQTTSGTWDRASHADLQAAAQRGVLRPTDAVHHSASASYLRFSDVQLLYLQPPLPHQEDGDGDVVMAAVEPEWAALRDDASYAKSDSFGVVAMDGLPLSSGHGDLKGAMDVEGHVHTAVLVLDTNVLLDHFDTLLQHLLRLRAALSRALLRVVVYVPYIVLSELDRQKNDAARPLLQRRATFTLRKLAAIVRGGGSDESYLRRLFVLQTLTDFIPIKQLVLSRLMGDDSLLAGLHDQYIRATAALLGALLSTQPTVRVALLTRDVAFTVFASDPRVPVLRFTQLPLSPAGLYSTLWGMRSAPEGASVEGLPTANTVPVTVPPSLAMQGPPGAPAVPNPFVTPTSDAAAHAALMQALAASSDSGSALASALQRQLSVDTSHHQLSPAASLDLPPTPHMPPPPVARLGHTGLLGEIPGAQGPGQGLCIPGQSGSNPLPVRGMTAAQQELIAHLASQAPKRTMQPTIQPSSINMTSMTTTSMVSPTTVPSVGQQQEALVQALLRTAQQQHGRGNPQGDTAPNVAQLLSQQADMQSYLTSLQQQQSLAHQQSLAQQQSLAKQQAAMQLLARIQSDNSDRPAPLTCTSSIASVDSRTPGTPTARHHDSGTLVAAARTALQNLVVAVQHRYQQLGGAGSTMLWDYEGSTPTALAVVQDFFAHRHQTLADCTTAQQREVEDVLQDLKGLLGGRREGRWPTERAARLYERTQELVQLVERLPEAVASPDDPPDEDAIPVCEACRALVVAKKALIV